ncbi:MAG TPA: acyltransferase [Chitinophagales bacterium]|nr:acyltransferase [Chitinophagales bacterium]
MLSIFKINTNPERRYFGFDIVRAFSVVLVMQMHFLQHFSQFLGINYFMLPLPDPVDMFFVCSGFLIGYQHLKEVHKMDAITPKYTARFLVMRWVRTLPSYYIMLTFLVLLFALFSRHLDIPFRNYFFVQSLYENRSKFYRETWTIAIEEWFYFTFPVLFYIITSFLKINKKKSFLLILLIYIIVCNVLKVYYYYHVFPDHTFEQWTRFREIVVLRIDTIAIGLLAAYICYFYNDFWERNKYRFLPFGLIIYIGSIFFYWSWTNKYIDTEFATFYHYTLFYFVSPISIMLCLPYLKTIKFKNNFTNHFILYTSLISYSIFLLHGTFLLLLFVVIYAGIIKHVAAPQMILAVTFIVYALWMFTTFFLSNLFFNKIELPIMNMRRKIIEKLNLNE